MAGCEVMPLPQSRGACSGKCRGGTCRKGAPRVWVVAACGGMVSLFAQGDDGSLSAPGDTAVFSSLDRFRHSIDEAEGRHAFDQLVIVGSRSDIAWVHAALPSAAEHHIMAEIEYPLLPGWFRQDQSQQLAQALGPVLAG